MKEEPPQIVTDPNVMISALLSREAASFKLLLEEVNTASELRIAEGKAETEFRREAIAARKHCFRQARGAIRNCLTPHSISREDS